MRLAGMGLNPVEVTNKSLNKKKRQVYLRPLKKHLIFSDYFKEAIK